MTGVHPKLSAVLNPCVSVFLSLSLFLAWTFGGPHFEKRPFTQKEGEKKEPGERERERQSFIRNYESLRERELY